MSQVHNLCMGIPGIWYDDDEYI